MAISVPVPKEITEYKEKIIFGMSGRQLICLLIAGILAVGIGTLCYLLGMDITLIGYIIIVATSPLMALGFIRKNNMPFERYLFLALRNKLGQNLLTYQTELLIDTLPKINIENEPKERKAKHGPIQKITGGRARHPAKECSQCTGAPQGSKGKRKIALHKIKTARQEYRTAKCRAATEAAGRIRP